MELDTLQASNASPIPYRFQFWNVLGKNMLIWKTLFKMNLQYTADFKFISDNLNFSYTFFPRKV